MGRALNTLDDYRAMIPEKALRVLEHILETGTKPQGYVGNRKYFNVNGKLPSFGDYREFDVDPRPKRGSRSRERLIMDQTSGRVWYTSDHYETFVEIEAKRNDDGDGSN